MTCQVCNGSVLVPLRSLSIKVCADCGAESPWPLKPGKSPVIEGGRAAPPEKTPDGSSLSVAGDSTNG